MEFDKKIIIGAKIKIRKAQLGKEAKSNSSLVRLFSKMSRKLVDKTIEIQIEDELLGSIELIDKSLYVSNIKNTKELFDSFKDKAKNLIGTKGNDNVIFTTDNNQGNKDIIQDGKEFFECLKNAKQQNNTLLLKYTLLQNRIRIPVLVFNKHIQNLSNIKDDIVSKFRIELDEKLNKKTKEFINILYKKFKKHTPNNEGLNFSSFTEEYALAICYNDTFAHVSSNNQENCPIKNLTSQSKDKSTLSNTLNNFLTTNETDIKKTKLILHKFEDETDDQMTASFASSDSKRKLESQSLDNLISSSKNIKDSSTSNIEILKSFKKLDQSSLDTESKDVKDFQKHQSQKSKFIELRKGYFRRPNPENAQKLKKTEILVKPILAKPNESKLNSLKFTIEKGEIRYNDFMNNLEKEIRKANSNQEYKLGKNLHFKCYSEEYREEYRFDLEDTNGAETTNEILQLLNNIDFRNCKKIKLFVGVEPYNDDKDFNINIVSYVGEKKDKDLKATKISIDEIKNNNNPIEKSIELIKEANSSEEIESLKIYSLSLLSRAEVFKTISEKEENEIIEESNEILKKEFKKITTIAITFVQNL